jgi:hypothetical protein
MSDGDETVVNPVCVRDAVAVIGVFAVLEGHLLGADLDAHLTRHLQAWLARRGLLDPDAGTRGLRQLLSDVNQRMRYAIGEYDEPPTPVPVD